MDALLPTVIPEGAPVVLPYMLRLPSYSKPFYPQDLRFAPDMQTLQVTTGYGVVTFTNEDVIPISFLDLELPTSLRLQCRDEGWEPSTIQELLTTLGVSYADRT